MADSMYGQQVPEHDAASDDAFEQHFQLRSDALHHPSPPTLSFNQTGLPSPFTWEQAYTDYIHSPNFSQPTYGSAPLYHEVGNENAALTHDPNYRDDTAAQRSFPSSYDLPSTSEALGSTSYADLMAIATATTSSADGQGIDPQHQTPARTDHLPALSIYDALLASGPVVGGSALDTGNTHLESPPSVTGARDMAYSTETSLQYEPTRIQPEHMHYLPSDVVHANPMVNILNFTDEPRASSRSFAQGSSGPSKKRSRFDDDDASQSPRPSIHLPSGKQRIPCKWQQVFGGGCVSTFCGDQQHDKHILRHLLDTDGTVFFSYMCKKCPRSEDEETMRAAIKRWRKKEEGGFSREDSCQRHVRTRHAEELKGDNPKELVLEVQRPWWWPSELMMTERYKGDEIGPKPEGETRTWKVYFQDIIDKYPEAIKEPNRPSLDDENDNDNAERTRPAKRRMTKKSATS